MSDNNPTNIGADNSAPAGGAARLRIRGEERMGVAQSSSSSLRQSSSSGPEVLVLRGLRSQEQVDRESQRVSWEENVKENKEQKTSKCCCQFHKKKNFGESSSDDSSSDSSDDSDGLGELGAAAAAAAGAVGASAGQGDAAAAAAAANSADGDTQQEHKHEDNCGDGACSHGKKKKRPRCTKEACYCGSTRFH